MTTPTDTTSTSTSETTTEGQGPDETSTTTTTETVTEKETEGTPSDDENALPEWARKELTKVRGEAANYRTRLREAETRLSQAKTPEEVAAAIADVQQKNAELERSVNVATVARKFGLPDELAEVLKGATVKDLEEHAKRLQKFAASNPERLGGGLDPTDNDDGEMDPRKLARRTRRR